MNIEKIHIIIFLLIAMLFVLYMQLYKSFSDRENLTTLSNESLQNLASVYNNGTLTVGNIVTTGNVSVGGNASVTGNTSLAGNLTTQGVSTLGKWVIRNDSIGIPDRGDINMGTDSWVRMLKYGNNVYAAESYAGVSGSSGGFAGLNLWSGAGTVFANNVSTGTLSASGTVSATGNIYTGGAFAFTNGLDIQSDGGAFYFRKSGTDKNRLSWSTGNASLRYYKDAGKPWEHVDT